MAQAKEKKDMNAHPFLFEDSFQVKNVDDSRFERAGRMDCESVAFTTNNLEIDINHIIYPVQGGDQIYVAITRNVSPADDPRKLNTAYDHDPRLLGRSVMDHFDYVMYGKVYKKEVKKEENLATVWASYGGLLMKLRAEAAQLADFHLNDSIYFMMRKVQAEDMDLSTNEPQQANSATLDRLCLISQWQLPLSHDPVGDGSQCRQEIFDYRGGGGRWR
eukprot:s322_g3.t2